MENNYVCVVKSNMNNKHPTNSPLFPEAFKEAFKSSFLLLTKMLEKALNVFSPNLNLLRLAVFKILYFKVNYFPLTSVVPFCQYCDRRLTFEMLT